MYTISGAAGLSCCPAVVSIHTIVRSLALRELNSSAFRLRGTIGVTCPAALQEPLKRPEVDLIRGGEGP